jgi:ABC-2 type transport system permease protein
MSLVTAAAQRTRPGPAAGLGLADALRAEWTKLRTVPGPGWLTAALCVATIGASAAVVAATRCQAHLACTPDPTRTSLIGVQVGQALAAVLAISVIGGEYGTGMIKTTFAAMPGRSTVLAAKATILTGVLLAAAVTAVGGSLAAGRLVLPGNGFTPARGFGQVTLSQGPTLRAAIGSVLYLILIGLLCLGIATIVRDSAVATGAALATLYVIPIVVMFVGSPVWQHRLERYAPTTAGLTVEDTVGLRHLPVGPWGGLGVMAAWAAAALLAAGLLLRLRDA